MSSEPYVFSESVVIGRGVPDREKSAHVLSEEFIVFCVISC